MSLIALGVTGGIGAYKAVEVARGLQREGHDVVAIMTEAARQFVGPLTFEAITGRRVVLGQYETGSNADIEHIAIASDIELLVVAPATANVIGKFANGLADDFLSTLYLATRAPVVLAPAMNTLMYEHDAVRRNLECLTARGVHVVEPGDGFLACGWIGKGRLAEPEAIVARVQSVLQSGPEPVRSLADRTVMVTAGPTYEDLDPVRYLGNRSTGRMGYALAEVAAGRGARTVLVSGPTDLSDPPGVEVVRVRSASEMHAAVMARAGEADAIIMAAAVADYTPVGGPKDQKITKSPEGLSLALERTPDILAELGAWRGALARPVLIGFAAETEDVIEHAREKLTRKAVDLIVANDVSRSDAGFGAESNAATLVSREGTESLELQPKRQMAGAILDRLAAALASG